MSEPLEAGKSPPECTSDEEHEDYLDYCAAAEAIDEALENREATPLEDFIEELGLREELGL